MIFFLRSSITHIYTSDRLLHTCMIYTKVIDISKYVHGIIRVQVESISFVYCAMSSYASPVLNQNIVGQDYHQ